ncbi:hypothetical protein SEES004_15761 [Salmonella enterica subsp. enterica serovar Senftenberg str. 361154004]|nr:hypothetical protein SEES004_15761 [Salmonella enterica subsp. enterica serovar Senftenberg str. 361154004]
MRPRVGGLSPLTRGTHLIPASVGTNCPVYPRWRGEHFNTVVSGDQTNGLSPLARGTRRRSAQKRQDLRFIPAGAGNTPFSLLTAIGIPVYPRWRGEHVFFAGSMSARARFIPAGAGNTPITESNCAVCAVYPRWRGEHARQCCQRFITGGLSPLARGTRRISDLLLEHERFIPAGAGNTGENPDQFCEARFIPLARGHAD